MRSDLTATHRGPQGVGRREHLGTAGGSAWPEGRVPGREWLEAGQASSAKLGSLNFISKAPGSYRSI